MSSTSISSALSSSSSPQPSSTSGSSGNGGSPRGPSFNNLTFVIIFFVLLVVFVGVATVSRRRFMARRHGGFEFDLTMEDDELTPEEIEQARPVLYELDSGNTVEAGWEHQKPLSAALIKSTRWTSGDERLKDDTILTAHPIETMPIDSQSTTENESRRFSSFHIPSWTRRRDSSHPKRASFMSDEEMRPVESTEALELAVMIAMPSRERSKSAQHNHAHEGDTDTHLHPESCPIPEIPEYQIGMMTVPWHAELKRESPFSTSL